MHLVTTASETEPTNHTVTQISPFKCQYHKMVKHNQNCLSLFDHLVTLALNELTSMSTVVNMICCDINNISS